MWLQENYSYVHKSHYTPIGQCKVGSASRSCLYPAPLSCCFFYTSCSYWPSPGASVMTASLPPVNFCLISIFFSFPEETPLQCLYVYFYQSYICIYFKESKSSWDSLPHPLTRGTFLISPGKTCASCLSNRMLVSLLLECWGLQQCLPSHHGGWEVSSLSSHHHSSAHLPSPPPTQKTEASPS